MKPFTPIILALLTLCTTDDPGAGTVPFKNSGFEFGDALDGWQLITYGPAATVALDVGVVHEGRQSLRVCANEASDTALGQDITLEPSCCYRFTGWVKTQGLERT